MSQGKKTPYSPDMLLYDTMVPKNHSSFESATWNLTLTGFPITGCSFGINWMIELLTEITLFLQGGGVSGLSDDEFFKLFTRNKVRTFIRRAMLYLECSLHPFCCYIFASAISISCTIGCACSLLYCNLLEANNFINFVSLPVLVAVHGLSLLQSLLHRSTAFVDVGQYLQVYNMVLNYRSLNVWPKPTTKPSALR